MASKSKNSIRYQPRKSSSRSTQAFKVIILLLVVIMILLGFGILSLPNANRNSSKPNDLTNIVRKSQEQSSGGDEEGNGERWVEVISWEPRAVVYHNFLTNEECEHLINLAKPNMVKSAVVDEKTGGSKDSRFASHSYRSNLGKVCCFLICVYGPSLFRVRTSSGTFLRRGHDEIVETIEKRISDFTFIPVENGEGLQVLHYQVGQKYEPHYDYFLDEFNTKNGGQRIATVLMYLSDVDDGGETVFPAAKGNISAVPWWNELSKCGKEGLSVLPKKRDALLFWNMRPDASLDPSSLHGGCPVVKGNKWSSTKWFHVHEFKV
ncbi:prolyl 4-hydroxylase 5 isoform X1 [Brassica napus]|uniref:prolyl 4-hydroxylase 5 isoform X1 n=1 Tax=Brassica napus TaxID=3708 RepID=UPI00207A5A28|nr:prolyl 4-hydroxylase 5 isoform X1 [Brassica napus]